MHVSRSSESHESANEVYWYAVFSRSRHEKIVATALTNTGVTTFLPLVSEMHSWSDRRKLGADSKTVAAAWPECEECHNLRCQPASLAGLSKNEVTMTRRTSP